MRDSSIRKTKHIVLNLLSIFLPKKIPITGHKTECFERFGNNLKNNQVVRNKHLEYETTVGVEYDLIASKFSQVK